MKSHKDHKHLALFDPHALLIFATRYCIGRSTIAAASHADELARAWPHIPDNTRTIIRRDLEEAFKHDDDDRERGKPYNHLGDDCDRACWERVRKAWEKSNALD